ncbi:MAG: T9SS type A sorting domain-containing protein, partial [Bacteroidota bacterium]
MIPSRIKLVLIVFSLLIYFKSESQIYKAGDTFSTYIDMIPDTLINYSCINHYSTESYYFDVNQDLQNDFELKAVCSVSPGFSNQYIAITSLNPNSYIKFGQVDSAYNNYLAYWMKAKVAKPLFYGDTINSLVATWDSTTLYLYYYYYTAGSSIMAADWISTNDEYIGIKYRNTTDTLYGWIRVNCPNSSACLLKDYSIGSIITSIPVFESVAFNIYPNPTTDYLVIETQKNSLIEILNIEGQILKTINDTDIKTRIDLKDLSSGLY